MNPYLLVNIKQKYWPKAPRYDIFTYELMTKFSHRLQIIFALEAAKLVLPIWEKHAPELLSIETKEAPKKTIVEIAKWLAEGVNILPIFNTLTYTSFNYNNAYYAYYSVYYAAKAVIDITDVASYAATSVSYAAATNPIPEQQQFCNNWWAICYLKNDEYQNKLQEKYDRLCKEISGGI